MLERERKKFAEALVSPRLIFHGRADAYVVPAVAPIGRQASPLSAVTRFVIIVNGRSLRCLIISHASSLHTSAESRKKSEVMQANTLVDAAIANSPERFFFIGRLKERVLYISDASRPTDESRRYT